MKIFKSIISYLACEIAITEEFLLRVGGIKSGSFYEIDLKHNIGYITINPKNGIVWIRHKNSADAGINPYSIHYVHQLRNLYFALTGREINS